MISRFNKVEPDPVLSEAGIHFREYRYDYAEIIDELNTIRDEHLLMTEDDDFLQVVREWAKKDMFFLAYYVLGYAPINHPFLIQRVYDCQDTPDSTMDLWPRGHWKSTIRTCIQPIFTVLNNSSERIGIFSHTRAMAKSHLRKIKQHAEGNDLLRAAFSDVFYEKPKSQSVTWSEDKGLFCKRDGVYGEGTFEAAGLVDGMPTGKHYTGRIYDDIVTEKSVQSADAVEKALENFYLSQFLVDETINRSRIVGTHYGPSDPYIRLHEELEGSYRMIRIGAEVDENGVGAFNGIPVYKDREYLDKVRQDAGRDSIYAAQMLMNPYLETESEFDLSDLRFYELGKHPEGLIYHCIVDPASSKKGRQHDFTVMWVFGTDEKRILWIVDIVRDKLNLKEKWEALSSLADKWDFDVCWYEEYAMQNDISYMEEKMEEERKYFLIEPIGGRVSKKDRIGQLKAPFRNHKIWLPKSLFYNTVDGDVVELVNTFVHEEYMPPKRTHDDMLDSLARIMDRKMKISYPMETRPREEEQGAPVFDPLNHGSQKEYTWMSAWI